MKLETDSSFVATEIHNTRNFVAPAVIDMGNFQAVIGEVHGRCRIGQRAIQHRADRSRVGNVDVLHPTEIRQGRFQLPYERPKWFLEPFTGCLQCCISVQIRSTSCRLMRLHSTAKRWVSKIFTPPFRA
ncbi:MAG: hypothetical protein CVT82_10490 [Alphaproteobacteria bacterium HGW-Alphaproteobacteria-4]|nr:MAG: hypothetical protein CVT82_10490 [Alphaproteobacteria bacterium HGW-Alphaproteobacteria-4]